MRVLVTGGSGFLGLEVVRTLRARGDEVRVLSRSGSPALEALEVDLVIGDVVRSGDLPDDAHDRDRAAGARRPSLVSALAGCDALVHLAGFVSRDPADGQRMMRLHIDGTRRALEAAAAAGVRRVIIASSTGTSAVATSPTAILDERAPYAYALIGNSPYHLSCIYKEQLAHELARSHQLELVIVAGSLLLGPGDARGASTFELRTAMKGLPFAPAGGTNFVDVRDAAAAIVTAISRGRSGERYFLGGTNWSYAELYARTARLAGVRAPWLGTSAAAQVARQLSRLRSVLGRGEALRSLYWYCDAEKARRELELQTRDPLETLADTVRDLIARSV